MLDININLKQSLKTLGILITSYLLCSGCWLLTLRIFRLNPHQKPFHFNLEHLLKKLCSKFCALPLLALFKIFSNHAVPMLTK